MTSRERLLTALHNGRPDRLPCQVHGWMTFYLQRYLGGMDWWQAYERFPGLDWAMYVSPGYEFDPAALANWRGERRDLGRDERGVYHWDETITTPDGTLHHAGGYDEITGWETEYLIKNERDFEIWNRYRPRPVAVDLAPVRAAYERLGDRGIIRSHPWSPGQGSPWQSFCTLVGTQPAILWGMDEPGFVHHCLEAIVTETLRVTEMWAGTPADMVETGGGAGSNTVISPNFFAEFCVPYDQRQHAAFDALGLRTVYHLCGGVMKMLDHVLANGAHGLETMTPPSMGGDCDLAAASRQVGDKLFFIGGFDQNAGFEHGTPERARQLVLECFEATKDHAGYICCPSDHFFHGDTANLEAFAQACCDCVY
ncbi:MAG: hypothetical protein HZB16_24890 [Armatimonadetes bacterium]|nr:hypothetical protein [Armatimonadota bacterium]